MPVTIRIASPDNRVLQITRAAAEAGRLLGETIDGLIDKAARAATLTDPNANRRYDQLAFYVEEDTIYGVWPYARPQAPMENPSRPPVPKNLEARPRATLSARMRPLVTHSTPPKLAEPQADGWVEIKHPPCNGVGCPACQYKGVIQQRVT